MHSPPLMPPLSESSPSVFESGHVWIQEYLDGALLRFQMDQSGLLVFGDSEQGFDPEAHPPHFEEAISRIRTDFDRDRFREGTDDPGAYTFFGIVPLGGRIEYDWEEIPPVLGADIWNGIKAEFVAEDVLERVFDRLGLPILPIIEKERPVRDVDPHQFVIPKSRWADETAAGVLFRKKHGDRTVVFREGFHHPSGSDYWYPESGSRENETGSRGDSDPESILEGVLTKSQIEGHIEESSHDADSTRTLEATGVAEIADSLCRSIAREEYGSFRLLLEHDPARFRHLVEDRVRTILTEER